MEFELEYPTIAGKTIKEAKSGTDEIGAYLELIFTDETGFCLRCSSDIKLRAHVCDREGEIV